VPRSSAVDACCAARACRENAFRVQWLFSREMEEPFLHGKRWLKLGSVKNIYASHSLLPGGGAPPCPSRCPTTCTTTPSSGSLPAPRAAPLKRREIPCRPVSAARLFEHRA